VSDPHQVDDDGNPVAGAEAASGPDPAAEAVMRRQIEQTLRFMRLQTAIGLVVIVVLAIILSDIRGVLLLVGFVYVLTSLGAYWCLRRNFMARLEGARPGAG
jgi:hypothetical protein